MMANRSAPGGAHTQPGAEDGALTLEVLDSMALASNVLGGWSSGTAPRVELGCKPGSDPGGS